MQLQSEVNPALNTVTAYGQDYIEINEVRYNHAVYFAPEGAIHTWEITQVEEITSAGLQAIAGLTDLDTDPMAFLDGQPSLKKPLDAPEVILIGTGTTQRMLPAHVTKPLLQLHIGIEAMSTQAAARTYNILMAEGRRVIVALLPTQETS